MATPQEYYQPWMGYTPTYGYGDARGMRIPPRTPGVNDAYPYGDFLNIVRQGYGGVGQARGGSQGYDPVMPNVGMARGGNYNGDQTAGLSGQYNNTPTDEYGNPIEEEGDYYSNFGSVPFVPGQQPQERQTQFRRSQDQLRKMQEESSKAPAWRSLPGGYGTAKQPSLQELMQLMQVMRY